MSLVVSDNAAVQKQKKRFSLIVCLLIAHCSQISDTSLEQLTIPPVHNNERPNSIQVLSHSKKYLFLSTMNNHARVIQSHDGAMVREIDGHTDSIIQVAFSEDEQVVATASVDKTIRIWSLQTKAPPRILQGHRGAVTGIGFLNHSHRLVSTSLDGTVRVWDLKMGKEVACLKGHADSIQSLAISPDEKWIATGGMDKNIIIWDIGSEKKWDVLMGHQYPIQTLFFVQKPYALLLASMDEQGNTLFFDVNKSTFVAIGSLPVDRAITSSAKIKKMLPGLDQGGWNFEFWGIMTNKPHEIYRWAHVAGDTRLDTRFLVSPMLTNHPSPIENFFLSDSEDVFITLGEDGTFRLFAASHQFTRSSEDILASFTPSYLATWLIYIDSQTVIVGNNTGQFSIWKLPPLLTSHTVWTQSKGGIWMYPQGVFSANEENLVFSRGSSHFQGSAFVIHRNTGQTQEIVHSFDLDQGANGPYIGATFSPINPNLMVTYANKDRNLRVWTINRGPTQYKIPTYHLKDEANIQSAWFCEDGSCLISLRSDRKISIWDITSGTRLLTMGPFSDRMPSEQRGVPLRLGSIIGGDPHPFVAIAMNGTVLFSAQLVYLGGKWGFQDGLLSPLLSSTPMNDLQVAKEGRFMAALDESGSIIVMDRVTEARYMKAMYTLSQGNEKIFQMSMSPNGQWIATRSGSNNTIRLWNTQTGQLQASLLAKDAELFGIAFTPSGRELAIQSKSNDIEFWDLAKIPPIEKQIPLLQTEFSF